MVVVTECVCVGGWRDCRGGGGGQDDWKKEKEIMSELSSGSCLMDSDIIV